MLPRQRQKCCRSATGALNVCIGFRLGLFAGWLIASPPAPPGARWHREAECSRGTQGRGSLEMWQNVSKISPLFCGKIFEIFCHGLPAGGRQLFRTSTIFLPLLTPTFRQTRVNDNRRCVRFYGFCKCKIVLMLGPPPPRRARRRYPGLLRCSPIRA